MKVREIFGFSKENYNKFCIKDLEKNKQRMLISGIGILIYIFGFFCMENEILAFICLVIGSVSLLVFFGSLMFFVLDTFTTNTFVESIVYVLDNDNNLYKIIGQVVEKNYIHTGRFF